MAKFVDIQSRAKEITEQQNGKLDKNREVNSDKGRIVLLWAGAKRRRTRAASDELAQELIALQRST